MPLDFSRPNDLTELMDDAGIDFADYRACLRDLAQVNRLTLTHRPTIAWLDRLRRAGRLVPGRPARLLDIGFGYGDGLRRIEGWARRHGLALALTGIDLNPWAAEVARQATPAGSAIGWRAGDVFTLDARDYDLVISSQMAHHLDRQRLAALLAWLDRAPIGWLIGDLHRHPAAYHLFRPLAALARWHRFVRHDGPVSILRSMTPAEWRILVAESGLGRNVVVRAWFPFRIAVTREAAS